MPELTAPTVRLHAAVLAARADWGPGSHEDGFGLRPSDEITTPEGFAAWVARLTGPEARTRCTYRWIVEQDPAPACGPQVLGAIALRHRAGEFGHIGYGIRPSARRRGLATWALGRILGDARELGLTAVLLICAAGNTASARTIEAQGGRLEDGQDCGDVRRYWITL
ncbi:GNAT family N-acetyltransferase [Actinoplanes sp. NPDC051494]|uniref:GNAT family N-acetyltransferase n=1 Tax=Actinoplanes sp. NPDC051494 TaxID=3363907 RepID=UPI003799E9E0